MSTVFDGYERQYCELSANLSRLLAEIPNLSADERKHKLSEVNGGLEEAESLTRRMDLEARSLPPAQKASLLAKIRELKADLNQLKKGSKAAAAAPSAAVGLNGDIGGREIAGRDELLEGGYAGSHGGYDTGRGGGGGAKMMSTTERLEHSSDRLEQSRRMLVETEDLGVSILEDLNNQRQTLLHARENLYGVDDSVAKARQILTNMARHMNRNRVIMAGVVTVLLLAIALVVWIKLRGNHS